jgi:NTE family protein
MSAHRQRPIDLALQGGGAHGAFTWGVLDRLLDEERLDITAISGTSAGAMNAVVLAHGLAKGGRHEAKQALLRFWTRVSQASAWSQGLAGLFWDWAVPGSPLAWTMEWMTRTWSPYQLNPLDLNPLRDILAQEVDFEFLRAHCGPRVFVSATHVQSGRLREFRHEELTVDAVMASACLPLLFKAVEIEGEAYWDGGYVANPSLLPLITESPCSDLVLVQINPACRPEVPTTARDILDRLNEITFNSSLLKELRSIALLQQLLAAEGLPAGVGPGSLFQQVARLRLHRIDATEDMADLGAASKLNAAWPMIQRLHAIGRDTADAWLQQHGAHIGRKSTLDLTECL